MKITFDIEETTLDQIMAITNETKKSPTVTKAVHEMTRRKMAQEFREFLMENAFSYPQTVEKN